MSGGFFSCRVHTPSFTVLDSNGRRPTRARGCERDHGGGARVRRRREHHCEGRVWRTRRGGGSGQERTRNGAMEEVFSRVGVTLKEHKRAGHTAGEALFSFKRKVGNEVCVEVCCACLCVILGCPLFEVDSSVQLFTSPPSARIKGQMRWDARSPSRSRSLVRPSRRRGSSSRASGLHQGQGLPLLH